jgi:hypothetical protein
MMPMVVLVVVFAGLVVFLLTVLALERPKREALTLLAGRFEGNVSFFSGQMQGKFQGFGFSVSLIPAGRNTPPRLAVFFPKHYAFNLRIYRETPLARLGKDLGLVREVKINDASFDNQFLIFSNRPVQAVNFLSMNSKAILRELFAAGFDSFTLVSKGITVQKPGYTLEDLKPEGVEQLLRKLLSITGGTA